MQAVVIIISLIAITASFYMLKKGINVGLVMLLDSAVLVLLTQIPFKDAVKYAFFSTISLQTIKLIFAMISILVLENIMRTTGMIKTMADSLKELVGSSRTAAAFIPAVIGLLPSPGGARFSCPMVEEVTSTNSDSANKAFINYWFRHVWMDGFILYPGIILASELLGVSVIGFFIRILPFMALRVLLGYFFSLKSVKKENIRKSKPGLESLRTFITSLMPVIIVISLYMLLIRISAFNITGYSLEISVTFVVIAMFIIKKYSLGKIVSTIKSAFQAKLILIIVGVMVFKDILFATDIMNGLPGLLKAYSVPLAVLYILLPFLGGVVSGIGVTAVSMTFPLLMHIGLGSNPWYAVMAFSAGFSGCMVTPLHLCGVMTADYFKSSLGSMLKKVIIAEVIFMSVILCIVYFLS